MFKKIICFLFIFNIFLLYSIELKYSYRMGGILYIETKTNFNQSLNGKFLAKGKTKEISYIQAQKIDKNWAKLISTFYLLDERKSFENTIYKVKENKKFSYLKDYNGKTYGLELMKGFHNFLVFPKRDLKLGETWQYPAFYNVSLFGESFPKLRLDFDVFYRLLNIEEDPEKGTICNISASAVLSYDRSKEFFKNFEIEKLLGFSNCFVKFSITEGRVVSIEETFDYTYFLENNDLIETSGTSYTIYESPPPPKQEEIERLQEEVENATENINVKTKADQTVSITLEKIQFKPDSAELADGELKRLDKIANLLKNYKSNHIIIVGHTADIGKKVAQLMLSEERAKSVLSYLIKVHKFSQDLLSFQGKGGEEPIADNITEEGRTKNRRVEIIILQK